MPYEFKYLYYILMAVHTYLFVHSEEVKVIFLINFYTVFEFRIKMPEIMERKCAEYKNLSEEFLKHNAGYQKQYCSIYLVRLKAMEKLLLDRIEKKWGNKYPVCKLHKLSEEIHEKCIVMGTLFKQQKLKPSVLKELSESNHLTPQPIITHYTDESDVLFIEDELQRYQLLGNVDKTNLVTGISCALLGSDIGKGKFNVEEMIFPSYRPQIDRPIPSDDCYILFISGLNLIKDHTLNLQLLTQFIGGFLNSEPDASKIVRIVIAGNSIRTKGEQKSISTTSMTSRVIESTETVETVKNLDKFLALLCQMIDVDLMPGEFDPSNHILPQKPMHHCMLPESAPWRSMHLVSNPHFFSLDGCKILGTSGQNVKDILRFSDISDPLEALEGFLVWNHLIPTAPDTLGCFPFYEKDPFILNDCPHVLFAGNQMEFATKLIKGEEGQTVRLICIPEFDLSNQAVVLNLKNLECYPISFGN